MDASQTAAVGGNGESAGDRMLSLQTNDTSTEAKGIAATADADPMQILNQLINSTQKTFGLNHQLYLTVSSFNTAFQLPLIQRMYHSPILFFFWCLRF